MPDVVVKLLIWIVVAIGLAPAVVLGLLTLLVATIEAATLPAPPANGAVVRSGGDVKVGMVGLGSIGLGSWHPRVWVGLALLAGAALIVAGLVFLLHVPPRR